MSLPLAELVRIANLSVYVSGSFDYLCSFYSRDTHTAASVYGTHSISDVSCGS